MLSHVSRADTYRPATLAALSAADVHPTVIESTYDGATPDAEVRARAYDALRLAQGDSLLFLEDDLDVRPELFKRHLAMAVEANVTTVFCAVNRRHYPPGLIDGCEPPAHLPAQLVPIPDFDADRGYHGSMAVYLPPGLVAHALARPEEFITPWGTPLTQPVIEPDHLRGKVTGFDFWIKANARSFGGMLIAVPNSIDHVGRNIRTGHAWPSPTFSIPVA